MDELEKDYGYSPERYEACMRVLFDLYARLFPGQEAQCVIQTMGPYMAGRFPPIQPANGESSSRRGPPSPSPAKPGPTLS